MSAGCWLEFIMCVRACMRACAARITTHMIDLLPQALSYIVAAICCVGLKHAALLHYQPKHLLQLMSAETPCLKAMTYEHVTGGAKVRGGRAGAVLYIICLTSVISCAGITIVTAQNEPFTYPA